MSIELDIEIIRSDRKSVSIEIDQNGNVKLRVPRNISQSDIKKVIDSKQDWIRAHIAAMRQKKDENPPVKKLSYYELNELANKALKEIPPRARYFADLMGVSYNRITVRNQKTRWGSCSEAGNLNFNCLLMLVPESVRDYVIVHELCHLKEMNHSPLFWSEVEKILPDYKEKQKWLKENGGKLIDLLPNA